MLGLSNGVVVKLQDLAPALVGIHCYAHRLELGDKGVVKKHVMYANFEKLLLDLWLFYKNR